MSAWALTTSASKLLTRRYISLLAGSCSQSVSPLAGMPWSIEACGGGVSRRHSLTDLYVY
eukprot:SAG25_NODE_463_length_7790_cov_6.841654_10_plen_60_part_00